MDIEEAIRTRRAIRTFTSQEIAESELRAILDAGRRAGSSKNLQRWDFIVVRDRSRLGELAAVGPFAGHLVGAALAVALVTPDPRAPGAPISISFDLGQAAANMMLAAWSLGIGSVPATVYEHELAAHLLGYPSDRHCEYILSFGYPADEGRFSAPLRAGGRKSLDEIRHDEIW